MKFLIDNCHLTFFFIYKNFITEKVTEGTNFDLSLMRNFLIESYRGVSVPFTYENFMIEKYKFGG